MNSAPPRHGQNTISSTRVSQALPSPEALRKASLIFLASAGVYFVFGLVFPPIPTDARVSFWESVVAGSHDPYPLLYAVWPVLIIASATGQQSSMSPLRILRRGTVRAAVASEAVTGAFAGLAAGAGAAVGSAITATGNGLSLSWSSFATMPGDAAGSQVLSAFALAETPVLSALLVPLFAWAGTLAAAAAGLAVAYRVSVFAHRISAACLILLPPVLFRAEFLPPTVNPISFLLPIHPAVNGLSVWIYPCIAFSIATLTVIQAGAGIHTALRVLRTPRSVWFLTALALAWMLLLLASPEDTAADALFYGTSPAGLSFVHWAYGVIVWLGLAMVSLVRWSGWVLPRFSLVALRHGTASRVLIRELVTDTARTLVSASAFVLLCAASGMIYGLTPAVWTDWLAVVLGGTASSMATIMLALATVWATSRIGSAALVVVAAGASTLPAVNPLWPAPSATGFLGAWESPWTAGASAISFCSSAALLILISKFRPLPEADRH